MIQANKNFNNGTWWAASSELVLVTDQNPSCAGESTSDSACNTAVNEAIELVNQDVRTYVLVPSTEARTPALDCLNRIAKQNAAKFPDAQQPILARTSQELSSRLDDIVTATEERICRFYIKDRGVEADQIEQIRIGTRSIPRDVDGQKGWSASWGGAIELSPEECKTLGSQKVTAVVCNSGRGGQSNYGP